MATNKRKKSVIWKPAKEEMQKILDTRDSYSDVMRFFGLNPRNGSIKTLYARIKEEKLDTSHLDEKRWTKTVANKKKFPNNIIFVENSEFSRNGIKKRIIEENLISYVCHKCGNLGKWQNETLVLQLEHKNGVYNDNRLENLSFLCPNCHTQTKTYAGKKTPNLKLCEECGKQITHQATKCKQCAHKGSNFKADWPNNAEMIKLVWQKPTAHIAKELGVSDKAVEKHCRIRGIEKPPRGYWQKQNK